MRAQFWMDEVHVRRKPVAERAVLRDWSGVSGRMGVGEKFGGEMVAVGHGAQDGNGRRAKQRGEGGEIGIDGLGFADVETYRHRQLPVLPGDRAKLHGEIGRLGETDDQANTMKRRRRKPTGRDQGGLELVADRDHRGARVADFAFDHRCSADQQVPFGGWDGRGGGHGTGREGVPDGPGLSIWLDGVFVCFMKMELLQDAGDALGEELLFASLELFQLIFTRALLPGFAQGG